MTQRRLVAAALTLVLLAVIGLLYLQALNQARATRPAWMVTRDLVAGATLDSGNVRSVRVPATGDAFAVLQDSPLRRRVAHRIAAQSLLTESDLVGHEYVQVPVSVRAAPAVAVGDTVDVYAGLGGRTVLIGRQLVVTATGNPLTLLAPAADEPYWISLQAGGIALYAAKSDGVGVPDVPAVSPSDAVAGLNGSARSGPGPAASPSPSPGVAAGSGPGASPPPP